MNIEYDFKNIEFLAQKFWKDNNSFRSKNIDSNKIKFYCVSMIPYPSGNLHIGHVRNYVIGDVVSRYQIMLGKNVFQPVGWDAFGLPAENSAILNKDTPANWTYNNIRNMRVQLKKLGMGYDWDKELITCKSNYYKWCQWLFIKLYENKLVYRKKKWVNWDPIDKTVLSNEQSIDGKGWRSNAILQKKQMSQWFFKITKYSDELLKDLGNLKGWPEKVKNMQKNWIGKQSGFNVIFKIGDFNLKVFFL